VNDVRGSSTLKTTWLVGRGIDCPACGSPLTLELGLERPLSTSLPDAILGAEEAECIEIRRDYWHCGWLEDRLVRVESIETTAGDEAVVERAALVDEITDKLTEIDRLSTLKDALAKVRRQRRLEPTTDETNKNHPE